MRATVKLPRVGETAEIVVILEWFVTPGSPVTEGAPMLKVETDKVTVDVPVPVSGTFVEALVGPDDEVEIGAPICVIETSAG
jgi:pyruvate/2-oxoglutarate dehydrogenase complex dihydrolipoamide acyltransferase (E2) component